MGKPETQNKFCLKVVKINIVSGKTKLNELINNLVFFFQIFYKGKFLQKNNYVTNFTLKNYFLVIDLKSYYYKN